MNFLKLPKVNPLPFIFVICFSITLLTIYAFNWKSETENNKIFESKKQISFNFQEFKPGMELTNIENFKLFKIAILDTFANKEQSKFCLYVNPYCKQFINSLKKENLVGNTFDWKLLTKSIAWHESRWNDSIKGPTGDSGYMQITPIYVAEANNIVGYEKYNLSDRLSRTKSLEMFNIVQNRHNPQKNVQKAIRLHNPLAKDSEYLEPILYNYAKLKLGYSLN